MKRLSTILSFALALISLNLSAKELSGRVTCKNQGVANVVVTDGVNCTSTDANGHYTLTGRDKANYVYISTPAGYSSPQNDDGVVQFHLKINEEQNEYNFELSSKESNENHHSFVVLADPQLYVEKNYDVLQYRVDDLRQTITEHGLPCHGMTAGDIVGNDQTMYQRYNQIMASANIEYRTAMGNHDGIFYLRSNEGSEKGYEDTFGPAYYSYNVGKIHYVVLNNNFYLGRGWLYIGYIDEPQLQWLENDLSYVAQGSTLVVMLHIPTTNSNQIDDAPYNNSLTCNVMSNNKALYNIVENYTTHIISGHTHINANYEIKDNLYEHNVAGFCGAWWQGPLCTDGTPAGYQYFEVDGEEITWYYKAAGYPRDFQMKVYDKSDLEELGNKIIANVWNYDSKWSVEISVDNGKPVTMEPDRVLDVDATKLYRNNPEIEYTWIGPTYNTHMFSYTLPEGAKEIKVIATDRFGKVYTAEKKLNR